MSNSIEQTNVVLPEPADDVSDSEESTTEVPTVAAAKTTAEAPNRYEKLERLKREKRLAMNRECARARRRRKKIRMELLENRVQELTQKNGKVAEANDVLRARVAQLEAELGIAKSGMALGMSGPDVMASNPSLLGARMPGLSAEASQVIAEKLNLQRRAALAGLGGATTGLGGLGVGGSAAGSGPGNINGNMDALRYMQLMQAKSAMGDDTAASMQNPLFSGAFRAGGR